MEKLYHRHEAAERTLHNNKVDRFIEVDIEMVKGEISYFEGYPEEAFKYLRKGIVPQDALKYDEPEGKMQPIRHSLGALLLKDGQYQEAEAIFRTDLRLHPRNPWALVGLIDCLKYSLENTDVSHEAKRLEYQFFSEQFNAQRKSEFIDYAVIRSCDCARSSM